MAAKEVLGFIRVERDHMQGYRTPKTIKSFWPGEVVVRERPILEAAADDDVERLLAYMRLDARQKINFIQAFNDLEIRELGFVVDPLEAEGPAAEARLDDGTMLDPREAASCLSRWRFTAHIDRTRVFEKVSTIRHSCSADVDVAWDRDGEMGLVTARSNIPPQARIGAWLLQDASVWWKGADLRTTALQASGLQRHGCCCERCQGDDTCRAIQCPGCEDFQKRIAAAYTMCVMWPGAALMASFMAWRRLVGRAKAKATRGEVTRNGKLKRWRCNLCDFNASDSAVEGFMRMERTLVQELADLSAVPKDKLWDKVQLVGNRIGYQHWLAPTVWLEIYRRSVTPSETEGKFDLTFTGVLAALRVFEWFVSRKLGVPPQPVANQLSAMIFATLDFLHSRILGVRDLRVVYLRAIDLIRVLIEQTDRSLLDRFKPFAGSAQNIRRRCAFCQRFLPEAPPAPIPDKDVSADDSGAGPVACCYCMDLCYCDMSCQMSDWKRHRHYCIPAQADFRSEVVQNVMVAV